jgi:isopenicillin N synthase-like dioxygenase
MEAVSGSTFNASIPVLDLNHFRSPDPVIKQGFIKAFSDAAREYGFMGIVDSNLDFEVLDRAYAACKAFFDQPMEKKMEINKPELCGYRGFIDGETAQGPECEERKKDWKQFLHIGRKNNIWPEGPIGEALKAAMEDLMKAMDEVGIPLQKAAALAVGEKEDYLTNMTQDGEVLLRPIYYPANPPPGTPSAKEHTDIDLFTLCPPATEEGLEIYHNGEWIRVMVPPKAYIVNVGDKWHNNTNGWDKSCLHRVVLPKGLDRYSIVYFIHPRDDDKMDPTEKCIALTGGRQRFPNATSAELLYTRLREIGLATDEMKRKERDSGIMNRVKELVKSGDAADAVKLTYSLRKVNREIPIEAKKETVQVGVESKT